MPRKLPKTGQEQFIQLIVELEDVAYQSGVMSMETGFVTEKQKLLLKAGTLRNKLIKLFETRAS